MKPQTKYKRALKKFAELMQMSVVININTDHAVFCDFSGHCNVLTISIGEDKHTNFNSKILDTTWVYLPTPPSDTFLSYDLDTFNSRCERIDVVHKKLKEWCDQNEVDVSGLNTKITSRHVSYI